jgi:2,3-dihydroxybiphenyl 1,2-dioxygenase
MTIARVARVRGLAYLVVEATDLEAWSVFASDLLGMQVASSDADRLLLRMDERSYRIDVRRSDQNRIRSLGWEVAGPAELDALAETLSVSDHEVERHPESVARARLLSGLLSFRDRDGTLIEISYGLKSELTPFVSPNGVVFVTGQEGMGHVFQMVSDHAAFERLYVDQFGFSISDHIDFAGTRAAFLHCNRRHHSYAFASFGPMVGFHHLMVEVSDIDVVGRAWDRVQQGAAPISSTLGRHTNDEMLSFYVTSPSGFAVEFGVGGKKVDHDSWLPTSFDAVSTWGHHPVNSTIPR